MTYGPVCEDELMAMNRRSALPRAFAPRDIRASDSAGLMIAEVRNVTTLTLGGPVAVLPFGLKTRTGPVDRHHGPRNVRRIRAPKWP
jgi:hypothetical protein